MSGNTSPIGVFDSGVGGLTVVKEIMNKLPHENIVYFGDTARVPYGNKTQKTVLRYSRQIVKFLKEKNVKAIVVACNTASALALDEIEKEIDIPIMGVVKPGVYAAMNTTANERIGVIATQSTIQSRLYQRLIENADSNAKVFAKACPLFVPLVEEGWTNDEITLEVAKRYLSELQDKDIDTLILGCTHYPLLYDLISGYLGEKIKLVNPAYETANALRDLLVSKGMTNDSDEIGERHIYVSDAIDKYIPFAETILSCKIENAQQIAIEAY